MKPDSFSTDTGYSYLALGDSYTIGEGVGEQERFPYLAAKMLREQGMAIKKPKYIAQTGWSTIALQQAITKEEPLGKWDLTTLLIGVNDQYQHLDTAGYRKRFTELLEKAIGLTDNSAERVFVLSIPDYSMTPFVKAGQETISVEIDAFNKINREITLAHGVAYVDITALTREVKDDPSLLANDGLHYSSKEHQKWAEKLVPFVRSAFE